MDSKDFNGPGFLLAVNTIFNFQDLPALRTGLTYNLRLLKNDVGFTDERLDRDTYVKYETVSLGIPVLAHFRTQSPFYFDAGLTFAFIIDAKEAHYWTKGSAYGFGTNISDTSPAIHILTNITKDTITIVNISDECAYEPRPFDMNVGFLFTYCDELSENPEVVTTQVFDDKMECGTIEYSKNQPNLWRGAKYKRMHSPHDNKPKDFLLRNRAN